MNETIDIAEDLGAVPPALPEILTFDELMARAPHPPPEVVEGILHQGCKMILGGTSKSNKSWCLLDLAISVASGKSWWGRPCTRMRVLYINFELPDWAIKKRLEALCANRPECQDLDKMLCIWNLRGHNGDLTLLRPKLEAILSRYQFGLIILDPAYKLLGNRDENANGDIANLMNEFEGLCRSTGAAVVVAHHFAKGDSTAKEAGDRLSGAGAWVRDPDSIVVLTPHEEPDCYTVTSILRNLPRLPDFVVAWEYPLMRLARELNPDALRRPQAKNKVCTDKEFVEAMISDEGKSFSRIIELAQTKLTMSPATTKRYLSRLKDAGVINSSGGLYWSN